MQRALIPKPEEDWRQRAKEINELLKEQEELLDEMRRTMTPEQFHEAVQEAVKETVRAYENGELTRQS